MSRYVTVDELLVLLCAFLLSVSAVLATFAIIAELTRLQPAGAGQVIPGQHRIGRHVLCLIRGFHDLPTRHPLGGFRCSSCGYSAATLDDLGWFGSVRPERRLFQRDRYPPSHGGWR